MPSLEERTRELVAKITEEEARKLLLTIDPLASLAEQQEQIRERLLTMTPADNKDLKLAWQMMADALLETPHHEPLRDVKNIAEQYLVMVTCRDEKEQIALLGRFQAEGLKCKALLG